jgi:hypothetical protein
MNTLQYILTARLFVGQVLTNFQKLRAMLKTIVNHKFFGGFIYLCIFYNTVTMGMIDFYVDRDNSSPLHVVTAA